jgi:BlaI family penicillinase repressor
MMGEQNQGLNRLPDAELDVMRVLWESKAPMKTAQVLAVLNREKSWTMSTLQALLSRLENRGFVTSEKKLRLRYYAPAVRQDGYRLKETKTFLKRLYNNSFKDMVAALIDDDALSSEDLDEIAELIRKSGDKND